MLKDRISDKFDTMPADEIDNYYLKPLNSWYGSIIHLYYKYLAHYCMTKPAHLKKGSKILDVGCGVGTLVHQFNKLGHQATGIDVNKNAIQNTISPRNCFLVQNSSKLDYPENFFDLIVSREVLEHIPASEIDDCINEWHRISKGLMIHIIAVSDRGSRVINDPAHINVQSERWWIDKFFAHGYKVIRRPSNKYFYPFGNSGYLMISSV